MHSDPSPYKRGQWIVRGTIVGAFVGLLFGKFAIGLIFGFMVGIFIDSQKRKAAEAASKDRPAKDDGAGP
jgi:F0F1-type ATP synthase assembly protein I